MAAGIEPFDGDDRAAGGATGQPDDALVDAPEPTLADLEQPAEVAGGGVELPEAERPQAARAPLLVQLRDAPRRRGRPRGLAPRLPPGRARVLGLARGRGRRGHRRQVRARGRQRRPPVLSLALSCPDLAPEAAEAAEATHFPGFSSRCFLPCASTSTAAQITRRKEQLFSRGREHKSHGSTQQENTANTRSMKLTQEENGTKQWGTRNSPRLA